MIRTVAFELTGIDGSTWPVVGITDCSLSTPIRLGQMPSGLNGPAGKHDDDQNVDQAGVTWRSTMFGPNAITLRSVRFGPVQPGEDALDRLCDFVDAFGDGRQLGRFDVSSRRRGIDQRRYQFWRLNSDLPDPHDTAVLNTGYVDLGDITIRSDESWWRADPLTYSWAAGEFSNRTVANLCDDSVWGYWEILGPITNPTIGLNGESITLLTTVPAGQTWRVDTDPNRFLVRDGANVDRSFMRNYWRERAPRRTAAVPVALGGTGTSPATRISVTLPQVFRSAL